MTDIPIKAIESFGDSGGIMGLVILLLMVFMVWYIHSSRKHHFEENAVSAQERREWRAALERNTDAFHELKSLLYNKLCLRSPNTRTRKTDRKERP